MSSHHPTWHEQPGDGDDGEALLPEALQSSSGRRLLCAGIYDAGEWYDVDYAGYLGELRFYRHVAESTGGVIVEIGAGTGRLTVPLVVSGHRLWGVEPAASMRALLTEKLARSSLDVVVEDAFAHTFVGPSERAHAVVFPFNGILHVTTHDAVHDSFVHIRNKLAAGGVFALDMTGPYWESVRCGRVPWGRTDTRVHPRTGATFLTCDRSSYDRRSKIMRIDIRYAIADSDELVETTLLQRMWTTTEILHHLTMAGFTIDETYGDVDLSPYAEGAPRLLVTARARE